MTNNKSVHQRDVGLHLQGYEARPDGPYPQGLHGPTGLVPMRDLAGDGTYLDGSILLGFKKHLRAHFFVEAIEMVPDSDDGLRAACSVWQSRIDAHRAEYDCEFETVELNSRRYMIFITPSGR